MAGKIITSSKLKGLEHDFEEVKFSKPVPSTGALALYEHGDEDCVMDWYIEFEHPATKDKFYAYLAEYHDLVREVLKDQGIDAK